MNLNGGTSHSFATATAIAGWTLTYYEPTYGMRSFQVSSWAERHKDEEWLNAGGYMYSIREIAKR